MNVFRLTPWVPALESRCRPAPSTNRNSSGWTSEVTMRSRSARKRISSRRQTIRIARSSEPSDAFGDADADDLGARVPGLGGRRGRREPASGECAAHRRPPPIICIITRLRCLPASSSASRIVDAGEGHEDIVERRAADDTERIVRPDSANSRGTNSSPEGTPKVTAPSAMPASIPKRSARSRRSRPRHRRCEIVTRSRPTPALSVSGPSRATISPWSMIAMRSHHSASSM